MEDTVTCPECGNENAYFDGVLYKCPDCDHEWSNDGLMIDQESFHDDDIGKEAYEHLIKKSEPFFKLAHGQLYSCKVEEGKSETTIIPLAFENGKNRLFVLWNAGHIPEKYPEFLKEVASKDFRTIKREENRNGDFPSSYKADPIMCTTDKDGTLINQLGKIYYDLILMS
jgi:hypothetical protein